MSTHVFAGQAVTVEDILGLVPHAVVHPPLRPGDLLALCTTPDDTVVVLDGARQAGRVQPDEFVDVLAGGTRVVGAAAAGALYAAELWPYGMQGVGEVFGMYAGGALECDDEVAVARPDGPRGRSTLPLVNLRRALAHMVTEEVVGPADAAALIEVARTLHYTRRSWCELVPLAHAVSDATGRAALTLRRLCAERGEEFDLVRQDARVALAHAAQPHPPAPALVPPQLVPRTWDLERRRAAHRPAVPGSRTVAVSELDVLHFQQLYAPDFPTRYRRFALTLAAGERLRGADRGPVSAALESARERGVAEHLLPAQAWAYWLTPRERRDLSTESQLLVLLVRSLRGAPGAVSWQGVPAELRGTDEMWAAGARAVAAADCLNRRAGDEQVRSRVRAHLEEVWQCTGQEILTAAARDRGFVSLEDAEQAARRFVRLRGVQAVQQS